jgi:hypothetical protein
MHDDFEDVGRPFNLGSPLTPVHSYNLWPQMCEFASLQLCSTPILFG